MSESMWGYLFLILGIMAAALLILFGNINVKNEENYYNLKEITQNAMLDSVDEKAKLNGLTQEEVDNIDAINCVSGVPTIRIVTEQFVENFTRRFAQVVPLNNNKNYKIEFYDIVECPAKVSVRITSTENYSWVRSLFRGAKEDNEDAQIVNEITSILETKD